MHASQLEPLGTSPALFDIIVSDIDDVIDRPPNPGWRITDFVNARSHILAYALSGRAHYKINDEPYSVKQGALIFMPKAAIHTASSDRNQPWHFMSLAFDLQVGTDSLAQLWSLPAVSYQIPLELAGLFKEIHAAWTQKETGYLLQIRGVVATILHQIVREHTLPALREPHTRRITALTKTLLDNYASTYAVEELARECGLSPSHFRLMFKRVTGMTATAYQQHIKITKAIEFLASGEYNVTETARLTGFRDIAYFSRLFTKMTGMKPSSLSKG